MNYKAYYFLIIIFFSCYTLERDCIPFHEGKFKFSHVINNEIKTSYFTRDSLYEIEFFDGRVDTAKIRWVNDCECILTKLNAKSYNEKRPIQIRILSTKQNSYTFEYSLVGDRKNKKKGKIEKIN